MVQEHLDEVWRAALAASGDQVVAEAVTTAVLCAAAPEAALADLVRQAVLGAARRARLRKRSFLRTLRTWVLTVASLRNSRSAISRLRSPSATSPRISRSRALRTASGS